MKLIISILFGLVNLIPIETVGAAEDFVFSTRLLKAIEWTLYLHDHEIPSRPQFIKGKDGDLENRSIFRLLLFSRHTARHIEIFENRNVLKYRYTPGRGYSAISKPRTLTKDYLESLSKFTENDLEHRSVQNDDVFHLSNEVVLIGIPDRHALCLVELSESQLQGLFKELGLMLE